VSTKAAAQSRLERRARSQQQAVLEQARRRRTRRAFWGVTFLAVGAVVAAMLLSARPESSDDVRAAPDFTLTDTIGRSVTLSDLRGENVVLYFSEGAGCQSCIVQMGEIEKRIDDFDALDVTVLPIVMNTREQIAADMAVTGVTTPFLLDDGTVSRAYGTLGKGMHTGLPGHSFVLVDKDGRQRWYGEYPSMWLSPDDLLRELRDRL
jgi:peroxiredoxin